MRSIYSVLGQCSVECSGGMDKGFQHQICTKFPTTSSWFRYYSLKLVINKNSFPRQYSPLSFFFSERDSDCWAAITMYHMRITTTNENTIPSETDKDLTRGPSVDFPVFMPIGRSSHILNISARQQLTLFRSTSRGLGYRHNNSFNCFHSRKVTAAACLYAIKITSSVLISINCEINPMFRRTSVSILRVLGVQKCRPFVEFPLMLTDLSRADDNLGDITVLGSANPLVEGE